MSYILKSIKITTGLWNETRVHFDKVLHCLRSEDKKTTLPLFYSILVIPRV